MSAPQPMQPSPPRRTPPVLDDPPAGGRYGAPAGMAIDPRALLGVLRRRFWLMAGVTLTVLAAVAWVVLREPLSYQATALIRLKDVRGALTGEESAAILTGLFGPQTDPVLSELQALTSRSVAREVAAREGLRLQVLEGALQRGLLSSVTVPATVAADTIPLRFSERGVTVGGQATYRYGQVITWNGVRFAVDSMPASAEATLEVVPERVAVNSLLESIAAEPRELTDAVDVSYTAGDALLAQRVTNTLVETFQSFNVQSAQRQARRRRVFLEEQIAATDSLLRAAQEGLSAFRSQREVYSTGERLSAGQGTITDIEVRRDQLASELSSYRTLLGSLERSAGRRDAGLAGLMATPEVAGNTVIAQLYSQLIRYQTTRDSMTAGEWSRSATDPDVQRYDQLIASTRSRLLEATRSHVNVVESRVATLEELRRRTAAGLRSLPSAEAREVRLQTQVEALRGISDQLQEQYQRARGSEVVEAGTVEIIDLADQPVQPERRRRAVKLMLGLMMGGLLAVAAAFLSEFMQASVVRREELEDASGLPVLAVVPSLHDARASRRVRLPGFGGARGDAATRPPVAVISAPRSSAADAYRLLRVNLMFSQAIHSLRTIVVASGRPGEGKTTTAANLAAAYAQQGLRTVLLDCDLRRPAVHDVFGVPREPGLTQCVLGVEPLEAVLRATQAERLWVIPAGALPPNPTEFLASPGFRRTLEAVAERFEVVVIDTPPVLLAPDATVLGGIADQVVVVARAGSTDRASVRRTVEQLRAVGGEVAGVILNDPDVVVPAYATESADRYTAYSDYGETPSAR